jgi:hypothetical protein
MTVRGWGKRAAIMVSLILPLLTGLGTVQAKIVVLPSGSVIEVDTATLKAVVGLFETAEDAIKAHDLDKVMATTRASVRYRATSAVLRFEWERP